MDEGDRPWLWLLQLGHRRQEEEVVVEVFALAEL
jgi:hypothetical protein